MTTDALRRACEEAAEEINSDASRFGGTPRDDAQIIGRHVSPVVNALVGAAYRLCAEETLKSHFGIYNTLLALTPEDAARALAEHDSALIEKCAEVCDDYEEIKRIKGQHDREGAAHNIAIAIRALSKPAPAVEPGKR